MGGGLAERVRWRRSDAREVSARSGLRERGNDAWRATSSEEAAWMWRGLSSEG